MIPLTSLPVHVAQVGRRLNVCSPDDLASLFLETSYMAEVGIKTIALVLHAALRERAPGHAYRFAYALIRADGLGTWESTIRALSSQPLAGYLSPEIQPFLEWLSRRRTKAEDDWFRAAKDEAGTVLEQLGGDEQPFGNKPTVRDLITALVQIRNKTKAHGAVTSDFYMSANSAYLACVGALIHQCPAFSWSWMHLSRRNSGKVRGICLAGDNPHHMKDSEGAQFSLETKAGVYFQPAPNSRPIFVGDLLKSNRDCTAFALPNGGYRDDGSCEFLNYSSGKTLREDASAFLRPPAPLAASETEGAAAFDVQSNLFGNLPIPYSGYVERELLQDELEKKLLDRNHPIITLHGGGGMGKTSLALFVAHKLARASTPHFEFIVWFSARDVDLRPSGPSPVRPAVLDLPAISKQFGSLFGVDASLEAFAHVLQTPKAHSDRGILFIFDNFETLADAAEIHRFLDEHTHLPNKVLITSRERAFKADYPIEVRGMELSEATILLQNSSRELGIETEMTPDVVRAIYTYTGGHAYVMRVILGEMAKEGRYTPPRTLMPRRLDIVDAVFERSFNKLSDAGRNVFLTVANWRSEISELALIVVLGQRGFDVEVGLEECQRLSLIAQNHLPDGTPCYAAPQLARVFGQKKLQGDTDRLVLQEDLEILRKFGVLSNAGQNDQTQEAIIRRFVLWCTTEAEGKTGDVIEPLDRILETLANLWAPGWLSLADFRRRTKQPGESILYALRRAVEEQPFDKYAWLERAKFAEQCQDEATRVASLISAVDADPTDVELIRDVALQLVKYIDAHKFEIPKTRRGVYLASVRAHMERISAKLDATGFSRLAWLFLLEENVSKAKEHAEAGCALDPTNHHCLKLLEKIESQIRSQ